MRKLIVAVLVTIMLSGVGLAHACVGKTLYIGISGAENEQLLAQMVSVLLAERTGTTVKVVTYKDTDEMYQAVKQGKVGVIIENTDRALDVMHLPKESDPQAAYQTVKREYRKSLNLVWLAPFGMIHGTGQPQLYAPVLSTDILGNLPALPKLLNKLAGILNDDTSARLLRAVKSDEKPKTVARDFLKAKKLI